MKSVPKEESKRKQGIPIKYGRITNEDFQSGLERLKVFVDFKDPKDIWRMARFVKSFETVESRARRWYKKLIDKHAVQEPVQRMSKITNKMEDARDEKTGKLITRPKQGPGPNGRINFIFKDQAAFNADIKIFDNHVEEIKVMRFDADDFIKAKLTPVELAACVMMIDNPPEELQDAVDDYEAEIVREELMEEDGSEDEGDVPAASNLESSAEAPA